MELALRVNNESEELTQAIEAFIEENLCGDEFLVCDEGGKQDALEENIKESLWAFNAEFIVDHMSARKTMSYKECQDITKALREMQEKLCESANPLVMSMITNIDRFIEDAVNTDGAGHFLNTYDGEEHEFTFEGEVYYVYRVN